MIIEERKGVPGYEVVRLKEKKTNYCVLIPVINEKDNIALELKRAVDSKSIEACDVIICDGNSTDGTNDASFLESLGVTTILIKKTKGKQGAQLRMGFDFAINEGYEGFITIDGNNKDSIEDIPNFVKKLDEGYDFVQGSRFIKGGKEINTPIFRKIMVKCVHSPIISLTAHKRYTDTTNAFRAYSKNYITNPRVDLFRDIFDGYELLAYTSTRASQIGLKTCEIPVTRAYPKGEVPSKIKGVKANFILLKVLLLNMLGFYKPKKVAKRLFLGYTLFMLAVSLGFLFLTIYSLNNSIKNYSKVFGEKYNEIKLIIYDENEEERDPSEYTDEEKMELIRLYDELDVIEKQGISKTQPIVFGALTVVFIGGTVYFYDLRSYLDERDNEKNRSNNS